MARPADSAGNPWRRTRRSFRFAFAGMAHMIRSQPNARIHLVIAAVACGLAVWLRLPPLAWALLAAMIGLVLALEALNTAVEAVVDLASPDHHELARVAKDCAAAAVLIAALVSLAVGACLFLPPLLDRFSG